MSAKVHHSEPPSLRGPLSQNTPYLQSRTTAPTVHTREIQMIDVTISQRSAGCAAIATPASPCFILPQPEKQTPLPSTQNLFIPDIPVKNLDGTRPHPRESWRWIVKHWTLGDPDRGLLRPLKDWDPSWLRGPNKGLYAAKWGQRSMIALEFINQWVNFSSVWK